MATEPNCFSSFLKDSDINRPRGYGLIKNDIVSLQNPV